VKEEEEEDEEGKDEVEDEEERKKDERRREEDVVGDGGALEIFLSLLGLRRSAACIAHTVSLVSLPSSAAFSEKSKEKKTARKPQRGGISPVSFAYDFYH
jgi:hypothetical protein